MGAGRTLVVGGGIGGLAAALCLARSGREVTVLERAEAFTWTAAAEGLRDAIYAVTE